MKTYVSKACHFEYERRGKCNVLHKHRTQAVQ